MHTSGRKNGGRAPERVTAQQRYRMRIVEKDTATSTGTAVQQLRLADKRIHINVPPGGVSVHEETRSNV